MIEIAGGRYALGSESAERELGYSLSPPAVRDAGWYEAWEAPPYRVSLEPFLIDRTPVTQQDFAKFVAATGHRVPKIDEAAYREQGFLVHPYAEVRPYLWTDAGPDSALLDHPVVLVDREDARAYCAWRGKTDGLPLRLPSESEWEAACRGLEARTFPWGDGWLEGAAHVAARGTAPVEAHRLGATPAGVLDLAGNVFEWTGTAMPDGRPVLKGCSWDDAPGTCRCAFRHGRPPDSRHILIGFRCATNK
jgi:formylglycine-generating enzyme required for sulfatase activity